MHTGATELVQSGIAIVNGSQQLMQQVISFINSVELSVGL